MAKTAKAQEKKPLARILSLFGASFGQVKQYSVVAFLIGTIMVMLVPLPAFLMDVLLGLSLGMSLLMLMATVFADKPLDLSTFPSVLLVVTLGRLALNIATTRLILSRGNEGPAAAGDLIASFASFVGGGADNALSSLAIGFTIFLIITLINFIVVTKGSGRIAEVAARFSLDAMPGQQMAIDADLNAGLIDEPTARKRRDELKQLTDFYGAMDGASKFVRGDAIAGIIITLINVSVGFLIGMVIYDMPFQEALVTYTTLTIGDGLISQIPSLLISISAGLLVTRNAGRAAFGPEIVRQFIGSPSAMAVVTLVLGVLGLSGMLGSPFPAAPLLLLAFASGLAWRLMRGDKARAEIDERVKREEEARAAADGMAPAKDKEKEKVEDLLKVEAMELEVGYGVVPLIDTQQGGGGGLVGRVKMIRNQLASELGVIIPPIRIRDNISLEVNEYLIKIHGAPMARGQAEADKLMAMDAGTGSGKLDGIPTTEPAFGLPAFWIDQSSRKYAEENGYTVVDPETVVATHLTEVIKSRAAELLTREEIRKLLDTTKEYAPNAVQEAEAALPAGEIQKVLQNLLRERVSIRNLPSILEALGDYGRRVKDPDILTEFVRAALNRWLCNEYAEGRKLYVITLDPRLEEGLAQRVERTDSGAFLTLRPQASQRLTAAIAQEVQRQLEGGHQALLLVSPAIRMHVKRMTMASWPMLAVMSYNEIASDYEVESVGMVTADLNG